MPRMKAISALLAAVLASSTALAATPLFTRVPAPKSAIAPDHLVGTTAVGIDVVALAAMKPGEIASFDLPNGKTYEVVLDRLERHANGDVTWAGRIDGNPDHPVILTIGETNAYGSFHTADGRWGIAPGNGTDWLFDADMSNIYVDRPAGTTDAVVHEEDLLNPQPKHIPGSCPIVTATPSPQATVDLLVAITPDFVTAHGGAAGAETRLNNLISSINGYYANSKVAITLRRVATINVDFPTPDASSDTNALNGIQNATGNFANLPLLRDLYGADMVMLMRGPQGGGNSISGLANIGGYNLANMATQANRMFSVNGDAVWAGGTLVAHELGHNMGHHHDPANAGTTTPGATAYAYGYTRCGGAGMTVGCPGVVGFNQAGSGGFGTIMSYWRPTIPRFSNPNDTCSGNNSGTVACSGTTASASPAFSVVPDEVRTLNCVRTDLEGFRAPHVTGCANPTQDTDGDGIPNCVESALGRNPNAKDNDIFAATRSGAFLASMQVYRDFLSREADPNGLNFWAGSVAAGTYTRAQMIEGFFNSNEFQGTIASVTRLYFAYFLRIPDYGGLQHWIGQYRAGTSLASISQSFASSTEFTNRYGALNNTQFVTLIYNNVLNRAPDAGGLTHWVNQLNTNAMTRGGVMLAFSESPEYRGLIAGEVFVTMSYVGMLKRAPDTGGFAYWVNQLDTGASGLTLLNGFYGSAEYRGRFLP